MTMRALVQRINRKLTEKDAQLKAARGEARQNLGDYYVLDVRRKVVSRTAVNLEALGRELEVLHPWERLTDERDTTKS